MSDVSRGAGAADVGVAPDGLPDARAGALPETGRGVVASAPAGIAAIDGRPLGERGVRTRRRLLDATARLLATRGIRDLRVVDIAREVGTSPATFYQYFRDVEEAVLVLADEAGRELLPVAELLEGTWVGEEGLDAARRLVDAFLASWDEHRAVLRTRNLQAQEGDDRFRAVRNAALEPFVDGVVRLVEQGRRRGRVPEEISPAAAGAALVALIERMAAFHVDLEPRGVDRASLVETTARIFHQTVTGASGAPHRVPSGH